MAADNNDFSLPSPFGLTSSGPGGLKRVAADNPLTMLPSEFEPGEDDVICQRGKDSFEHVGNKRFRELIDKHIDSYLEAGSRQEKSAIVAKIYDHIRMHASKPSSGFVRKDLLTRRWFLVNEKEARDKVGQALRDAIKIIRSGSRKETTESMVSKDEPQRSKRRKRSASQVEPRGPSHQSRTAEQKTEDSFGLRDHMWPHLMSSRFLENQAQALGPFPISSGTMAGKIDDFDGIMSTMLESSIQPIETGNGQKRKFSGIGSSLSSNNAFHFGLNLQYADMLNDGLKKSPPMGSLQDGSPLLDPKQPMHQENPSELQLRMNNTLGMNAFLPPFTGSSSAMHPAMHLVQQQQQPGQGKQGSTGPWDLEPTPLIGNGTRDYATTSTEQRASALAHLLWPDDRYNA
eukprot:CAMPEP_0176261398 /NCGR_PEP_ID=MMETSP0121_2-20121125/40077_1 /TAXON_ID=160619 /ORGANISM="Kryptoperidinium foliaceum, Strain CCMP 1326" /LENGTH=401 /DNA_ID=CAMNT_0017601337 /DNA_START=197 /DNA_END=1405 /DNA_ORIENTATION=+